MVPLQINDMRAGTVLAFTRVRVIIVDSLKEKVRDLEREEILNALKECNGVMARAARKLGITERVIGYKIKKYGIRREERMGMTFTSGIYYE